MEIAVIKVEDGSSSVVGAFVTGVGGGAFVTGGSGSSVGGGTDVPRGVDGALFVLVVVFKVFMAALSSAGMKFRKSSHRIIMLTTETQKTTALLIFLLFFFCVGVCVCVCVLLSKGNVFELFLTETRLRRVIHVTLITPMGFPRKLNSFSFQPSRHFIGCPWCGSVAIV